jgi:AcrR family transcriptional regulator
MAKQARAVRTRQAILEAAAAVFEERGYDGSTITEIIRVGGITKGALYFHFQAKEDLALGVLAEQELKKPVPPQASKVQELVDTGALHAYRMQTDPVVRASVRLSLDQRAQGLDRTGPFNRWIETTTTLLARAKEQGELLPHVLPIQTAEFYVGAFAGVQMMSQTMSGHADLDERVLVLQRHVLPSIALPSVLASLDLSPGRGARIAAVLDAEDGDPADGDSSAA